MTRQQIEEGLRVSEKITTLENALNTVTNSVFDGQDRKEVVSNYIHNGCLSSEVLVLLSSEDCKKINSAIYDVLCENIKKLQEQMSNI